METFDQAWSTPLSVGQSPHRAKPNLFGFYGEAEPSPHIGRQSRAIYLSVGEYY
jgi:hypothetical protein